MKQKTTQEKTAQEKKIHIVLPGDLHQRLRVKCALEDMSIQQYVEDVLQKVTKDIQISKTREHVHVGS